MGKQLPILSAVFVLFLTADAGQFYNSRYGDKYFIENDKDLSWYDAIKECASRNMRLITPDTLENQLDISKIFGSFKFDTTKQVWTSGLEVENYNFVWTTTGNKLNYTNWQLVEPKRIGSLPQCIGMSAMPKHDWVSNECSTRTFNVICEEIPILRAKNKELAEFKKNKKACDIKESSPKVSHETVNTLDMDLLKSFYKNETDFLLTELKKFFEVQMDNLRNSHANEMHHLMEEKTQQLTALRKDCEGNAKILALNQYLATKLQADEILQKFLEQETNLLVQVKSYLKETYELLNNDSSAGTNNRLGYNSQNNSNE